MRTIGRRHRHGVFASALVAAVWLLAESRPPLPSAAGLTSASGTDRLLGFLVWLGCLLLAIGLLARLAARSRARGIVRAAPIRHLRPLRREPRHPQRAGGGYSDRAFPLIPRPGSPLVDDASPSGVMQAGPAKAADRPPMSSDGAVVAARISVLGPLTITGTRKRGRRLRGATRELLAYLALHPAGAPRDQIIDALWPDQTPEQGRNRLWRAAADARDHLGEAILTRDNDRYQLDRSQVTVDLDQLECMLAQLGNGDRSDESLPVLEQALALFTDAPIGGGDFRWAESEQRRLHAIQLDLLERVGRARLRNGDASGALASAEEGLRNEPYNEGLARLAMQAEAALGLRSAIITRYENLNNLLEERLGLQPHRETRRVFRQLLGQDPQPLGHR